MSWKEHPQYNTLFNHVNDASQLVLSFLDAFRVDDKWYLIIDGKVVNQHNEVAVILGMNYPWGSSKKNPGKTIYFPELVRSILEKTDINAHAVYEMMVATYGVDSVYDALGVRQLTINWIPRGALFTVNWHPGYPHFKERVEFLDKRKWNVA
jgi:hypothetical protein